MTMGPNPEQITRAELDTDTNNLLALWGVLEHDQILNTVSGEVDAKSIVAALVTGIRDKRQVEVIWQHEKKPQPPKATLNQTGNKVTITIDQTTLTKFENEVVAKLMPGGISPHVEKPEQYLIETIKKLPAAKRTGLITLAPINQVLIDAYNYYQQIP